MIDFEFIKLSIIVVYTLSYIAESAIFKLNALFTKLVDHFVWRNEKSLLWADDLFAKVVTTHFIKTQS